MRGASARLMAVIAIDNNDKAWGQASIPELKKALEVDYTSADLLFKLITIELNLGQDKEAQFYFNRFKLVDSHSPFIRFVKDLHERQPPPSLPKTDGLEIRP